MSFDLFSLFDYYLIEDESEMFDDPTLMGAEFDIPYDAPLDEDQEFELSEGYLDEYPHDIGSGEDIDAQSVVITGTPDVDGQHWSWQGMNNSCAIVAQEGVIESLLGYDIPKTELEQMAYNNGWYDPKSGTPIECVGNILEAYGVPVEQGHDKSLIDIYNALDNDEKVIVALDPYEIWEPTRDYYGRPVEYIDTGHAVWVTGMDMDKEGNLSVIINDSGTIDGMRKTVSLEDFKNAWDDFGNFAVITNHQLSSTDEGVADTGMLGGYYNADGTYHYTSDGTDRDVETGKIVRRW